MSKFYIFLFIVIILIVGVGIGISYFYIEKPKVESSSNFINISLAFFDNKNITSTGYILAINSNINIYSRGITPNSGYLYLSAPINSSIFIYNYNIENQTYYTNEFKKLIYDNSENIRADIALETVGNCSLNVNNRLINNPLIVDIACVKPLQTPLLCVRWTSHIITASILNATQYKIPKHLEDKVDKCYRIFMNTTSNNQSLTLSHLDMSNLDNKDYIKLILIEGDKPYYSPDILTYSNLTGGKLFNEDLYLIN